jgi:golgi phosphoprotein 3
MTLTLIDQLTLLALDDNKGVFIPDSTTFSYAIAGAIILELVLEEQIDITDDLVTVKRGAGTDNPVLNQFLEMIRASKKERKIKSWLEKSVRRRMKLKKIPSPNLSTMASS